MEYSITKRQEPGQRRQDVAIYRQFTLSVLPFLLILYQMLAAIGETFDPALTDSTADPIEEPQSLVTGVIVSSRAQFFRISIWTRLSPSASTENDPLRQRIEVIGHHFKENVLGFSKNQKLAGPLATEVEFQSHKDSEKKGKGKKITV